jgi:hypothetical protein
MGKFFKVLAAQLAETSSLRFGGLVGFVKGSMASKIIKGDL